MNRFKLFFILIILFITGCNYTELNSIDVIKNIGIDYNGNYIIYTSVYDLVNNNKVIVNKYSCIDIKSCFNDINNSNKEINLSHIDLIVFSTNLTNSNYLELFNYFIDNNVFRCDYISLFSSDIASLFNNNLFNEINDMYDSNKDIINMSLMDVINDYFNNNSIYLTNIVYSDDLDKKSNLLYKDGIYEEK